MSESAAAPLHQTALNSCHLASGARMVPFGGWSMPVQYQGILAEHQAVRESVGVFDLSHMGRLHFHGVDGLALLERVSTNRLGQAAGGRALYNLICDEQGGILDDTVAYNLGDHHLLVVNASNRVKILEWLGRHGAVAELAAVQDTTYETVMIGVQGPLAEALLQPLTGLDLATLRYYSAARGRLADFDVLVARTGYTGEDGFELIAAAADGPRLWELLAARTEPARPTLCGLGARDTLRLEAGMPLYGHEIGEQTNPYEAGLGRVVKLDKGPFVGRDALEALSQAPPVRRLVGFQMVDPGVPRQGYRVWDADGVIGEVTSGTFSPTLKRNLGLAYVPAELAEPGSAILIEIRDRRQRAEVVALPHVPHRTRRLPRSGPTA